MKDLSLCVVGAVPCDGFMAGCGKCWVFDAGREGERRKRKVKDLVAEGCIVGVEGVSVRWLGLNGG